MAHGGGGGGAPLPPPPAQGGGGGGGQKEEESDAVQAIHAESEQELEYYVGKAWKKLEIQNDWKDRVDGMQLLQGLVVGGVCGGEYSGWFAQEMADMMYVLEEELVDRRSQVAREACQLVSTLMKCGGGGGQHVFGGLAVGLQPVLLKLHGVSMGVVARGARECLHVIYECCHEGRLLPQLCAVTCTDRNGKLRLGGVEKLLTVVKSWKDDILEEYRVDIEQTILCACQDANSDVRHIGRDVFVAYSARSYQHAQRLLFGLGPGERKLREKLENDMVVGLPSAEGTDGADVHATVTLVSSPKTVAKTPARLVGPQRVLRNGNRREEQQIAPRTVESKLPKSAMKSGGAVRLETAQKPSRVASRRKSAVFQTTEREAEERCDFAETLKTLQQNGVYWSEKVDAFRTLTRSFESMEDDVEAYSQENIDVFCGVATEEIGDAHFKVAIESIQATSAAARNSFVACHMDAHLDRIVSALFLRVADAKESIRDAAYAALAAVEENFYPDTVVHGIVCATHVCKTPKVQCALISFFERMFSLDMAASGNAWRTMLSYCLRMATNKNVDVRTRALAACAKVYHSGKPAAVEAALAGLAASPRAVVSKALKTYQPDPEISMDLQCEMEGTLHDSVKNMTLQDDDTVLHRKQSAEKEGDLNADASGKLSGSEVFDLHASLPRSDTEFHHSIDEVEAPEHVHMLSEGEIMALSTSVMTMPTVETFRALNAFNAENLSVLQESHRTKLGKSLWSALGTVLSSKEKSRETTIAACSTILSFADMVPNDTMEQNFDGILNKLIDTTTDYNYELSQLSLSTGVQIVKMVGGADSYCCLTSMLPHPASMPPFRGDEATKTCSVLKLFKMSLYKVPSEQLKSALDSSLPSLCRCFESPNAEIRKLSMDCIIIVQKVWFQK